MRDPKASVFLHNLSKWLVPIAALFALAIWIYITPPGFMGKLAGVGYAVCHRLDSHSLHVGGLEMPLCARCSGEFNAAAVALIFQALLSGRSSRLPRRSIAAVLVAFFLAFAFDGSNSYLALMKSTYAGALTGIPNLYTTTNATRVFTGSGMGIAMGAVLFPMYNQTIWRAPADRPALDWRKFAALVGIVLLFDIGMLTESPWVLYPVALLSTLGVVALLSMVFSIVWVMIMRQENFFEHARQLWLPAVAGLTLAFLLIVGIDLFRFNLTHTWSGFPGLKG